MSEVSIGEWTGAGETATGPEVAKAACLTTLDSADGLLPPDESSLADCSGIDGAALLDRVHHFVRRFICFPSDNAAITHVLWIVHTHLMDAWFTTPRLAVLSPEGRVPRGGVGRFL